MATLRRLLYALLLLAALKCRNNPFGPPEEPIEGFNLYFTDFAAQDDGGMKAALVSVINGARATLYCAFSSLTASDVIEALKASAQSGITIQIAFDAKVRNSDAGSLALQSSGLFTVMTSPSDSIKAQLLYGNNSTTGAMRHNYCLADERYVWVATAPPDDTLMQRTPNIAIKVGSPQFGIARDFLRESGLFSQLLFGNGKAKTDFNTKFSALDQVIAVYWGPQEDPMNMLGTELSEATKTVDFYSTAFQATNTTSGKSHLDVPTVLKSLETAKGVSVRKYFSTQALFDPASKAYTLSNPAQYVNNLVKIGPNIFVVDRNTREARVFIYTGALRTQANSSDDSVLIELRGERVANLVGAYLDRIGAVAIPVSNVGDTSAAGEVVISELMWMGSYNNSQVGDSSDEFVEFYNNTGSAINLSGWKFACTTDGSSANSSITLPPGALIAPGGYFVIATKNTGAFAASANHFDSKVSVTNSSRECRLGNGKTSATSYGIANFGDVIDTIGNNVNGFDSGTWNRGVNQGSPNFIRRSMERINTAAAGTTNTNWRNNGYTIGLNTYVGEDFRNQTFASPGASGTFTESAGPGDIVINEILWMGSYTNSGTGDSDDEFIELHNKTSSNIDISSWTLSGTGISTITIPTGQTIPANGYYVIARNSSMAVSSANYNRGTSLGISNTAFQIELRTSLTTLIDTAGNGGTPLAGVNDTSNVVRRSMERKTGAVDGTLASSWQSGFSVGSGIASGYSSKTIATPGEANSTIPADPAAGDVVINEIMWMGTYDNSGTGQTDDEFIELWNKTASPINISFWTITGTGVNPITLPPAQTIPANGYYVIARNNANAFPSANYYKISTLGLSASTLQLELRTSLNTLIDTANNGGVPFAGLNDTGAQIRRSMERRANATDGTVSGSWYTAMTAGTGVAAGFNARTFATPGQANSFFLTGATATASTTVTVQFNDAPVPGSGTNGAENIANYSITGGLTVSAASLSGNTVTLTTSAQVPAFAYTLTVNNVLASGSNGPLSPNTANFNGYSTSAVVKISELNSNITSCDLVELKVITGGNMSGIKVIEGGELSDTVLITFPSMTVSTGDIIVLHLNSGNATCNPTSASNETSSITQFPQMSYATNYDTAWDVWSADTGLANTDNVIVVTDATGTAYMDAVAISNNDGAVAGAAVTDFCAIYNGIIWTDVPTCTSAAHSILQGNAVIDTDSLGTSAAGNSFQRVRDSGGAYCDSSPGKNADFALAAPTWGADSALGAGACP